MIEFIDAKWHAVYMTVVACCGAFLVTACETQRTESRAQSPRTLDTVPSISDTLWPLHVGDQWSFTWMDDTSRTLVLRVEEFKGHHEGRAYELVCNGDLHGLQGPIWVQHDVWIRYRGTEIDTIVDWSRKRRSTNSLRLFASDSMNAQQEFNGKLVSVPSYLAHPLSVDGMHMYLSPGLGPVGAIFGFYGLRFDSSIIDGRRFSP